MERFQALDRDDLSARVGKKENGTVFLSQFITRHLLSLDCVQNSVGKADKVREGFLSSS